MKHLFASGEVMYKNNVKQLSEGNFVAEFLNYDHVSHEIIFEAIGELESKPASVHFKLNKNGFEDIEFRHMIKILMQSDIFQADWEYYTIKYIEETELEFFEVDKN